MPPTPAAPGTRSSSTGPSRHRRERLRGAHVAAPHSDGWAGNAAPPPSEADLRADRLARFRADTARERQVEPSGILIPTCRPPPASLWLKPRPSEIQTIAEAPGRACPRSRPSGAGKRQRSDRRFRLPTTHVDGRGDGSARRRPARDVGRRRRRRSRSGRSRRPRRNSFRRQPMRRQPRQDDAIHRRRLSRKPSGADRRRGSGAGAGGGVRRWPGDRPPSTAPRRSNRRPQRGVRGYGRRARRSRPVRARPSHPTRPARRRRTARPRATTRLPEPSSLRARTRPGRVRTAMIGARGRKGPPRRTSRSARRAEEPIRAPGSSDRAMSTRVGSPQISGLHGSAGLPAPIPQRT